MTWRRPVVKPLNVRRGLAAGFIVAAGALAGYLTGSRNPSALGAAELVAAALLAAFVVAAVAVRTNHQLRGRLDSDRRG
jgi:hypothetical protein